MARHTAGPWIAKLTEDGDDEGGYGTYSPNGEVIPLPTDDDNDPEPICTMYSFNPADLTLIAAAPELLEASSALLSMLAVWLPDGEASADYIHVWDAAEKVEQAITKARGTA
jgi:hypothetical protein